MMFMFLKSFGWERPRKMLQVLLVSIAAGIAEETDVQSNQTFRK